MTTSHVPKQINLNTWFLFSGSYSHVASLNMVANAPEGFIRGFIRIKTNDTRVDLVVPVELNMMPGTSMSINRPQYLIFVQRQSRICTLDPRPTSTLALSLSGSRISSFLCLSIVRRANSTSRPWSCCHAWYVCDRFWLRLMRTGSRRCLVPPGYVHATCRALSL
jgi:hypothetical protein